MTQNYVLRFFALACFHQSIECHQGILPVLVHNGIVFVGQEVSR